MTGPDEAGAGAYARVAPFVQQVRDCYLAEFADRVVALLPEWTRWLSARNATPPELTDRCLPYALGQQHSQSVEDGGSPDYQARVIE